MIRVTVVSEKDSGRIKELSALGHAEYDEPGKDIICSAVSTVFYTLAGYFDEKLTRKEKQKRFFEEKEGYFKWIRPEYAENISDDAIDAVSFAALTGLRQIEYSYGKKYVEISYEEVNPDA